MKNFQHYVDSEKCKYLTNSLGEYDSPPPELPYDWYCSLVTCSMALCYLFQHGDKIGIMAIYEYSEELATEEFNDNPLIMTQWAIMRAQQIDNKVQMLNRVLGTNAEVYAGMKTGFDSITEIGIFIPWCSSENHTPTSSETVQEILKPVDDMAYDTKAFPIHQVDLFTVFSSQTKAEDGKPNITGHKCNPTCAPDNVGESRPCYLYCDCGIEPEKCHFYMYLLQKSTQGAESHDSKIRP